MTPARYDLLIFDFDGTIVSSIEGIASCMIAALTRFGYPAPTTEAIRKTVGLTLEDSIRILTDHLCPEEDIPSLVKTYRDLHLSEAAPRTRLFDGAAAVLADLERRGISTVLVSNKGSAGLLQLLDQLSIGGRFNLVLSADRVQHRKPSGLLYDQHIAERFPKVRRDRALVIGDTESDLQFALNVGAASCWASYGYGDPNRCAALNPTYTLTSIDGLLDVLPG